MSDISNAPILTRPQPKNDPLEVEKLLQGVESAVSEIPNKVQPDTTAKGKQEERRKEKKKETAEANRFEQLAEKIGASVGGATQTTMSSVIPAALGPMNLVLEPFKQLTGVDLVQGIQTSLTKGLGGLFGKRDKEEENKGVGAYGSGIIYEERLDERAVREVDPGSVFLAQQLTDDQEEKAGFFENLLKGLGLGGLAGLGGLLMKGAGLAALAVGLTWGVIDGIWGWGEAENWGVDGWAGVVGGFLSGQNSGWEGALMGAGKLGSIGMGVGGLVGGPMGMLIGGLIGAAVGGILGYMEAEDIAVGVQGIWDKIQDSSWLAGLAGAGGGAVLGFKFGGPVGALAGGALGFALGGLLQALDGEELSWSNIWKAITETPSVTTGLGAFTGMKIGMFFGPVGMLVGALLGAALGFALGFINRNIQEERRQQERVQKGIGLLGLRGEQSMDFQSDMGYMLGEAEAKHGRGEALDHSERILRRIRDEYGNGSLNVLFDPEHENHERALRLFMSNADLRGMLAERSIFDEETLRDRDALIQANDNLARERLQEMHTNLGIGEWNERKAEAEGMFAGEGTETLQDGIIYKDGKVIHTHPDDNIFATKNDLVLQEDINSVTAAEITAVINDEETHSLLRELIVMLRDKEMGSTAIVNNRVSRFSPDSVYKQLSAG